jgi:hypothetical protein
LKENFDRFNFALYKEKQMADFRRYFIALAVLALMAGAASAQVGLANGTASGGLLACVATAGGTPELRPEGYTELTGDIVISCTGGQVPAANTAIPTTTIVVYMAPSVPVTSRFLNNNSITGASEALLIVDEAGSTVAGGVPGFGPSAPQILCTTAQQQANGGGSGSPCVAYAAILPGTTVNSGTANYTVAASAPNSGTAAPNVFQGKVGDYGVNSVAFYSVPVLAPATNGVSRTYRITNIRVPVPGGNLSGTLQAIISTSGAEALPVAGTAINIGVVGPPMKAGVKPYKANPFQQCAIQTVSLTANLIFTEGFAQGFKTRVVPGGAANLIPGNSSGNTAYAAEATNTVAPNNQNIPGGLYGGFAVNSESGFIFPGLASNNTNRGAVNYIAGLADYGTRLKAVFYNIPAGVTLYVSANSGPVGGTSVFTAPTVIGGTSVIPYAVLVATSSGEATQDSFGTNGSFGIPGDTTSKNAPITGATTDGLPAVALSANSSGAATAVWEVTNANPNATDVLSFSVYVSYAPTATTTTNPYGLPITDLPLGAPVNDVQLSYSPEPSGGTFTTANATQGQAPTPRFAVISTQEGRWTTVNLCQTTLLYPFVTAAAGFDTGIAVANTSMDPFGTVGQTGSCALYGYGVTIATAGNTAAQPVIKGCDAIANPVSGTNCFGIVSPGQVTSVMASSVFSAFQGYVIAVCNFQYAHGYAAVTDLGLRNLWSSYLALELAGSPRGSSIETLGN